MEDSTTAQLPTLKTLLFERIAALENIPVEDVARALASTKGIPSIQFLESYDYEVFWLRSVLATRGATDGA